MINNTTMSTTQEFNYHISTDRYGLGGIFNDKNLIKAAREDWVMQLGFCERVPNPNLILPDEEHRMLSSEVGDYISSINKIKKENPDMTIMSGFESEYDPMKESFLGEMRDKVDYMILEQHHVSKGLMNIEGTNNPNYPIEYANAISDAIDSGIFDIIACPDMFMQYRDTMDSEEKRTLYDRNCVIASQIICKKARDMGIPIEISLKYFNKIFWKIANETEGLKVLQGFGVRTLKGIQGQDSKSMDLLNIIEMMKNKFVEKDYNPVVARKNNVKLQEAYKLNQGNALTFETHMINQLVSNICNGFNDDLSPKDMAVYINHGINAAIQECIIGANTKDKSVMDGVSAIVNNKNMPLDEKKVRLERNKKVIYETNQVLSNQQLVMEGAKNSVLNAVNMGCQNKSEIIDMTTKITEYNSSKNEIHKNIIGNEINTFQQSNKVINNKVNNVKKLTLVNHNQSSVNHSQSSGFATTISITMIVIFMIGFVAGITYMLCKLWIGG